MLSYYQCFTNCNYCDSISKLLFTTNITLIYFQYLQDSSVWIEVKDFPDYWNSNVSLFLLKVSNLPLVFPMKAGIDFPLHIRQTDVSANPFLLARTFLMQQA